MENSQSAKNEGVEKSHKLPAELAARTTAITLGSRGRLLDVTLCKTFRLELLFLAQQSPQGVLRRATSFAAEDKKTIPGILVPGIIQVDAHVLVLSACVVYHLV